MRIDSDIKLDFQDVLIRPKRSTITSRKDVDLTRVFKFKYAEGNWTGIPIVSANMDTVTNSLVARIMAYNGMLSTMPKEKEHEASVLKNCATTLGLDSNFCPSTRFICIDVANGYIEKFTDYIKQVRKRQSEKIIIAGNVVTPEMTEALILAGADIVKVGLGSGSACSTRMKTGVGYPQLSAVIECADAAHGLGGHIISDGGCVTPADVVKAFGAGADFVMLGGMLAGHSENGSEFYGMSSRKANEKYHGGLAGYKAAEGLELKLPYRGPIQDTLDDIKGGLRSACAYVGARSIKELPKCTTFVRVNRILNSSLHEYKQ